MRRLWKNHKGVTMMEVLVTVGLLAIVVVPCLSSFVVAQRGNVLADQTYHEYTYAANLVEELKGVYVEEGQTWKEAVAKKLASAQENESYNISAFVKFVEFADGDPYCEISIYTGEHADPPDNDELLILKGVIAP